MQGSLPHVAQVMTKQPMLDRANVVGLHQKCSVLDTEVSELADELPIFWERQSVVPHDSVGDHLVVAGPS
jgi:hypothetical protein